MRLLELFKGTGSISKVFEKNGWECITLDIDPKWSPTHCCDIMDFDYKQYPPSYFDMVHCSPPCQFFSCARNIYINRFGHTKESLYNDILEKGLPPLIQSLKIIQYFQPAVFTIENPSSGKMKDFLDLPFSDCSYCSYGFLYRKNTRFWNNIGLKLEKCKCKGMHPSSIMGNNSIPTSKQERVKNNLARLYAIPQPLCESIYEQVMKYLADPK